MGHLGNYLYSTLSAINILLPPALCRHIASSVELNPHSDTDVPRIALLDQGRHCLNQHQLEVIEPYPCPQKSVTILWKCCVYLFIVQQQWIDIQWQRKFFLTVYKTLFLELQTTYTVTPSQSYWREFVPPTQWLGGHSVRKKPSLHKKYINTDYSLQMHTWTNGLNFGDISCGLMKLKLKYLAIMSVGVQYICKKYCVRILLHEWLIYCTTYCRGHCE